MRFVCLVCDGWVKLRIFKNWVAYDLCPWWNVEKWHMSFHVSRSLINSIPGYYQLPVHWSIISTMLIRLLHLSCYIVVLLLSSNAFELWYKNRYNLKVRISSSWSPSRIHPIYREAAHHDWSYPLNASITLLPKRKEPIFSFADWTSWMSDSDGMGNSATLTWVVTY